MEEVLTALRKLIRRVRTNFNTFHATIRNIHALGLSHTVEVHLDRVRARRQRHLCGCHRAQQPVVDEDIRSGGSETIIRVPPFGWSVIKVTSTRASTTLIESSDLLLIARQRERQNMKAGRGQDQAGRLAGSIRPIVQ